MTYREPAPIAPEPPQPVERKPTDRRRAAAWAIFWVLNALPAPLMAVGLVFNELASAITGMTFTIIQVCAAFAWSVHVLFMERSK